MKRVEDAVRNLASRVVDTAEGLVPVLILGETGSGKEVVARALHQLSPRRDKKLFPRNCADIPPTLAETTLFGQKAGAFTGALNTPGWFEDAGGGTLFLDEVGELPIELQAKLLRVVEHRQITRVGETTERRIDARLIYATHRPLKEMAEAGQFRHDLLTRLARFTIEIPPLRDRGFEELCALVGHFWPGQSRAGGAHGFSPKALEAMHRYDWPGNVRQLKNFVQSLYVELGNPKTISDADVQTWLARQVAPRRVSSAQGPGTPNRQHKPLTKTTRKRTLEFIRELNRCTTREAMKALLDDRTGMRPPDWLMVLREHRCTLESGPPPNGALKPAEAEYLCNRIWSSATSDAESGAAGSQRPSAPGHTFGKLLCRVGYLHEGDLAGTDASLVEGGISSAPPPDSLARPIQPLFVAENLENRSAAAIAPADEILGHLSGLKVQLSDILQIALELKAGLLPSKTGMG